MESERSLVERVLEGDRAAFRELIARYERLVRHIVGRVIDAPGDPEAVFQDVFIRVYRGLPNFRGDSKLSTWIGRIAYNTAAKRASRDLRSARAEADALLDGEEASAVHPVQLDVLVERELREYVRSQVALLPRDQRVAITLHHLDGIPIGEVAEIMTVPENTVKSHLFRGRKTLKELLKGRIAE